MIGMLNMAEICPKKLAPEFWSQKAHVSLNLESTETRETTDTIKHTYIVDL